jgi:hypothetical protein
MHKFIFTAICALTFGCGKGGGIDGKLDELAGIKDKMCACPDKACADAQHEAYISWKKGNDKDTKLSDDQKKKFGELRGALQDCRHKFDAAGSAAPTTPPTTAPSAP